MCVHFAPDFILRALCVFVCVCVFEIPVIFFFLHKNVACADNTAKKEFRVFKARCCSQVVFAGARSDEKVIGRSNAKWALCTFLLYYFLFRTFENTNSNTLTDAHAQ